MNIMFLYGIGGAEKKYGVLKYCFLKDNAVTTPNMIYEASRMRMINPCIEHVYAISRTFHLKKDFNRAMRENSIEGWAVFKDILEHEAIKII